MGDVVNLRQARKRKARAAKAANALAARLHHGRTKAQREAVARERKKAEAELDGHLRRRQAEGNHSEGDADGDA